MCKVYDVVNQRIMELLKQGTVPWRKTWNAGSNYPRNISGREYRGVNVFMLACQEFSSPYWMTFKQVQDRGGHVIKGSRSEPVVFWKWVDRKGVDAADSEERHNGKVPLFRYYSVFRQKGGAGMDMNRLSLSRLPWYKLRAPELPHHDIDQSWMGIAHVCDTRRSEGRSLEEVEQF